MTLSHSHVKTMVLLVHSGLLYHSQDTRGFTFHSHHNRHARFRSGH